MGWGHHILTYRRSWFEKFQAGDFSLENWKGRGRVSEIDHYELKEVVDASPGAATREITEELKVGPATVEAKEKFEEEWKDWGFLF